jgi:hypothetical protein
MQMFQPWVFGPCHVRSQRPVIHTGLTPVTDATWDKLADLEFRLYAGPRLII